MIARLRAPFAALALAVAVSACGSDSPSGPALTQANLNQILGELSPTSSLAAVASLSGLPGVGAPSVLGPNCAYTAAVQSFVCPTQTSGGFTVTASYVLLDASGASQSAFSPTATAAVRTTSTARGSVASGGGSTLTVDAGQTLTLSGILAGVHTLDGTATMQLKGTVVEQGTSLPIDVTSTTTFASVVLPPSAAAGSWPRSGTITSVTSFTTPGVPAFTSNVKITFNGTSKVAVVVTVAGTTDTCTIDLASQFPSCG